MNKLPIVLFINYVQEKSKIMVCYCSFPTSVSTIRTPVSELSKQSNNTGRGGSRRITQLAPAYVTPRENIDKLKRNHTTASRFSSLAFFKSMPVASYKDSTLLWNRLSVKHRRHSYCPVFYCRHVTFLIIVLASYP
jgi:hypothetical protein